MTYMKLEGSQIAKTILKRNKVGELFLDFKTYCTDFLSGPVFKILPSSAWGVGLNPGWGAKVPNSEEFLQPRIKKTQLTTTL